MNDFFDRIFVRWIEDISFMVDYWWVYLGLVIGYLILLSYFKFKN